MSSDWLTVVQVAERFGLSRDAVYRRIREGKWDSFVTRFGRTLIDPEGLEQWLRTGGDRCRSDSDRRDQGAASIGRRSSQRRAARPSSVQPAASARQRLEQLLPGGTERQRIREIK